MCAGELSAAGGLGLRLLLIKILGNLESVCLIFNKRLKLLMLRIAQHQRSAEDCVEFFLCAPVFKGGLSLS
jgi:hypothetical protein